MTTEFDIGDEVWYGYPVPHKGIVSEIIITRSCVQYGLDGKRNNYWEIVGKTEKETRIRGIKSDLESHERYIEKLKKELEELEKRR